MIYVCFPCKFEPRLTGEHRLDREHEWFWCCWGGDRKRKRYYSYWCSLQAETSAALKSAFWLNLGFFAENSRVPFTNFLPAFVYLAAVAIETFYEWMLRHSKIFFELLPLKILSCRKPFPHLGGIRRNSSSCYLWKYCRAESFDSAIFSIK